MTTTIERPTIESRDTPELLVPEIESDLTRRKFLLGAGLIVLAPYGCGTESGEGGQTTSGETRTVRSKFGRATIEGQPSRVVALDARSADAALALDVVPVAILEEPFLRGSIPPWTKAALNGNENPRSIRVSAESGIPFERVAEVRPDLILAVNSFGLDEDAYGTLSQIAPVVHFAESPYTETWQDGMRRAGLALGRPDRARDLVSETERDLETARGRTPTFEDKTVNVFNVIPGTGLGVISDPSDFAIRFVSALGMRLDPEVEQLGGEGGRTLISEERIDLLDADLLIGSSPSPQMLSDLEQEPLFEQLDSVRDGRYVPLSIEQLISVSFPSLLSVRYAIAEVVSLFAAAIDGDPDTEARAAS